MSLGSFLFGFDGRINRAKMWLFFFFVIVVYIAFGVVLNMAFGASMLALLMTLATNPKAMLSGAIPLPLILFCLFYLVMFYIGLAVSAKRLHDRNKGAIWLLVFFILPLVLNIAGAIIAPPDLATGLPSINPIRMALNLASLALSIWAFVELYCLRGTVGDNQYGPDPLPPPVGAP